MTIIKPAAKERRPVVGPHVCPDCEAEFLVEETDIVDTDVTGIKKFIKCPECAELIYLNPFLCKN